MDWTAAIDKNRGALKRILVALIAMAEVGLGAGGQFTFFRRKGGGGPDVALAEKSKLSPALTLPRHLHRYLLRLLRPTEAAARRLIIVAARGLTLPPRHPREPATPRKIAHAGMPPQNRPAHAPALPLFDPLPRWNVRPRPKATSVPRICVPGFSTPFPIVVPRPDDRIDATRLAARLAALASALDDLPAQANRFARWRARAMRPQNPPPPCGDALVMAAPRRLRVSSVTAPARARRLSPLRPGHPPGWRRKPVHEVHEVLDVVHGLAHWVLVSPDTS